MRTGGIPWRMLRRVAGRAHFPPTAWRTTGLTVRSSVLMDKMEAKESSDLSVIERLRVLFEAEGE